MCCKFLFTPYSENHEIGEDVLDDNYPIGSMANTYNAENICEERYRYSSNSLHIFSTLTSVESCVS